MAVSEVAPYLLTPLDNAMPRNFVPKILFFPEPGSMSTAIDTLRLGLTRLIEDVPLFSGTLKASGQKGGLCVTAPWSTIEEIFQVKDLSHESGLDYQNLRSKHFPLENLGNLAALLPIAGIRKSEPPVILVQLNIVRGGMIMVLCVHHSFSDGLGTFAIARAWAAHCRGEDGSRSITKEMLDRERLMQGWDSASLADAPMFSMMPHKEQAASNGILSYISAVVSSWLTVPSQSLATSIRRWIVGTKTSNKPPTPNSVKGEQAIFFFSKSKLAELKSIASIKESGEDPDVYISTNDALCALIGCCILSAGDNHISAMSHRIPSIALVVGLRRALDPPLPEYYIGNVLGFLTVRVPTQSMDSTPALVSEVAYGLRDQIKQHKEPYLRKVIAALSSVEDISKVTTTLPSANEGGILCSSWATQKYHDINWGDGVGTHIERTRAPTVPNLVLILPELSGPNFEGEDCGLEAVLNLKKGEMERLKQNKLFMRYAQWRCN